MNREKAKEILGENATEEQVTALLNSIHTELEAKDTQIKELNTQLTNSTNKIGELTGYEAELKKIKESQMSEQEKFEQQKAELQAKLSATSKLANSIKAKSILIGAGISSERADSLVNKFVKEDEQATLDLANEFVEEINAVKELTTKQVKDNLSKLDVTPSGSNVQPSKTGGDTMTMEKFSSLSAVEQNKFVEEHPDEFAKL